MTLENELHRIANALEGICLKAGPELAGAKVEGAIRLAPEAPPAPEAVTGEQVKRRGRPPKLNPSQEDLDAQRAAAAPPATAPDFDFGAGSGSFLDDPPAAPVKYTMEDVRRALVSYGKKCQNAEKARKLLKDVGGVDVLPKLPEDKFAAVIAAAEKV